MGGVINQGSTIAFIQDPASQLELHVLLASWMLLIDKPNVADSTLRTHFASYTWLGHECIAMLDPLKG